MKTKSTYKRPYCHIGVNKYQLYSVNGVLRFENTITHEIDYNTLWLEYYRGNISLSFVLLKYVTSGSSYELVYGLFAKCGMNSDNILQGSEKPFKFQLYA